MPLNPRAFGPTAGTVETPPSPLLQLAQSSQGSAAASASAPSEISSEAGQPNPSGPMGLSQLAGPPIPLSVQPIEPAMGTQSTPTSQEAGSATSGAQTSQFFQPTPSQSQNQDQPQGPSGAQQDVQTAIGAGKFALKAGGALKRLLEQEQSGQDTFRAGLSPEASSALQKLSGLGFTPFQIPGDVLSGASGGAFSGLPDLSGFQPYQIPSDVLSGVSGGGLSAGLSGLSGNIPSGFSSVGAAGSEAAAGSTAAAMGSANAVTGAGATMAGGVGGVAGQLAAGVAPALGAYVGPVLGAVSSIPELLDKRVSDGQKAFDTGMNVLAGATGVFGTAVVLAKMFIDHYAYAAGAMYDRHRRNAAQEIGQNVPKIFEDVMLSDGDPAKLNAALNQFNFEGSKFKTTASGFSGGYEVGDKMWPPLNKALQSIIQSVTTLGPLAGAGDPQAQASLQAIREQAMAGKRAREHGAWYDPYGNRYGGRTQFELARGDKATQAQIDQQFADYAAQQTASRSGLNALNYSPGG